MMAVRREKGLCFNCDEMFTPGHRCKSKQFLCLLAEENTMTDEDVESFSQFTHDEPVNFSDTTTPSISLHAFTGQFVPRTLKVTGSINGHSIVALFDGGSTHNFIQSRLAKHLGMAIQPIPHLNVTVGNGDTIGCLGLAHQQSILLGQTPFSTDLYLLPIYGADIVLGVEWLAKLGPVSCLTTKSCTWKFQIRAHKFDFQVWLTLPCHIYLCLSFKRVSSRML